ncbi:MAG: hypothetical protein NVS3B11_22350 [Collimonas sp.]
MRFASLSNMVTSADALDLNVTNIEPQNIVFDERRHCTEYPFVEVLATAVAVGYGVGAATGIFNADNANYA